MYIPEYYFKSHSCRCLAYNTCGAVWWVFLKVKAHLQLQIGRIAERGRVRRSLHSRE